MARIRTIKPGFWTDEDLSELPEATHMLAAQLLNYADDDGYFNANPKLIIAEVSPLREPSVSIQDSLDTLCKIGYLQLGKGADGKRYGRIVNFTKHQRINRPSVSKIKGLEISFECSVSPHPQFSEPSPPEGKGKEGNKERERERGAISVPSHADLTVQAWNDMADQTGLAKVQKLTAARRAKATARFKDVGGMEGVNIALEKLKKCPFLLGENDRGWKADFDFFLQEKSFTKLMEGGYDRTNGTGNGRHKTPEQQRNEDRQAIADAIAPELATLGNDPASRH